MDSMTGRGLPVHWEDHPGLQGYLKDMRMAGQTGDKNVKVLNLKVVKIIPENNLLLLKGSVPGAKGSYVIVESPEGT